MSEKPTTMNEQELRENIIKIIASYEDTTDATNVCIFRKLAELELRIEEMQNK